MSATTETKRDRPAKAATGWYVYGIVPADVEVSPNAQGIGDPPGRVNLVRSGEIGALVSEIRVDRPLGEPADIMAYAQLLDATATQSPVLPMRFGAILTDLDAVLEELLAAHHDEFRDALAELEGRVEYVVRGRYVEDTILREILSEDPDLAQQRDAIRGQPPEAIRDASLALGEAISRAIEAKRDADTRTLVDRLGPCCVAVNIREPVHELDAVHIGLLVDTDRQAELEDRVAEFGRQWADRADLKLYGPLAPYDFVVSYQKENVTHRNQTGR